MEAVRLIINQYAASTWRHRWAALGVAWLICGLGWLAVIMLPSQYEASTRVAVNADAVLTPLLRGLAVDDATATQLDLMQRTLLSEPNIDKLISKTDLELAVNSPAARQNLVHKLATDIKILPEGHGIFSITYRNSNPKLAYSVVQTLLSIFIETTTGANQADMQNAQRFLQRQISSYEQQLRDAEKRRADFRAKYVDILPDATGGSSRLQQARQAVSSLTSQLQDAILRRDAVQKELSTTPSSLMAEFGSVSGGGGMSPLAQAEQRLQMLRLQYTDSFPDVIAQKQVVQSLRAGGGGSGAAAGPQGRPEENHIYGELKLKLVDAETTVASLQRQVHDATVERDRLESIARAAPGVEAEYANLDRDYNVIKKAYEDLLGRRESTNISEAADTSANKIKLQVINPPQLPRSPISPNRLLLMSGVLVAGLGGGVALAFMLAQFDNSFRLVDDLRSLGLPVLGGISMLPIAGQAPKRAFSTVGFGVGVLLLIAVFGGLLSQVLRASSTI